MRKELNEAETRAELIDPALAEAGWGQVEAKRYCERLQVRFAYSTNGKKIYRADLETGAEGYVERYPAPDELWQETYTTQNSWRDRFAAVPFEDRGGTWEPRYYQHNAISTALGAITEGKDRILLTLATGTGKTAIAFQLSWKLFIGFQEYLYQ